MATQPYTSYASAVARSTSAGAMAGQPRLTAERHQPERCQHPLWRVIPDRVLVSLGYREHFGEPSVPDREFWKDRSGEQWRNALRRARVALDLGDRAIHVWNLRGWTDPGTTLGVTGTSCPASSTSLTREMRSWRPLLQCGAFLGATAATSPSLVRVHCSTTP